MRERERGLGASLCDGYGWVASVYSSLYYGGSIPERPRAPACVYTGLSFVWRSDSHSGLSSGGLLKVLDQVRDIVIVVSGSTTSGRTLRGRGLVLFGKLSELGQTLRTHLRQDARDQFGEFCVCAWVRECVSVCVCVCVCV